MGATLSARGLRVGTTRRTHDRHVVTHRVTPLSQESTLTATLRLVPPRRGPRLRLASCGCLWRCVPRTQNQRSIRDRPQLLRLSAALLVGARPRFKLGPLEAERLARTNQYPYSEPAIPLGCFSDSFPIGLWVLRSAESQLRQLPGSTRASSFRLRFKLGPRAMHFDFCFIAAPFAESPLTQLPGGTRGPSYPDAADALGSLPVAAYAALGNENEEIYSRQPRYEKSHIAARQPLVRRRSQAKTAVDKSPTRPG